MGHNQGADGDAKEQTSDFTKQRCQDIGGRAMCIELCGRVFCPSVAPNELL